MAFTFVAIFSLAFLTGVAFTFPAALAFAGITTLAFAGIITLPGFIGISGVAPSVTILTIGYS